MQDCSIFSMSAMDIIISDTNTWTYISISDLLILLIHPTVPHIISYLVSQSCLYEAEQHLVGLPRLLRLGSVQDAHHLINALRQKCCSLHFHGIILCFISLATSGNHKTQTYHLTWQGVQFMRTMRTRDGSRKLIGGARNGASQPISLIWVLHFSKNLSFSDSSGDSFRYQ